MIKNTSKNKGNRIENALEYFNVTDNLNNPYTYEFGKVEREIDYTAYHKLHHFINKDYFNKR